MAVIEFFELKFKILAKLSPNVTHAWHAGAYRVSETPVITYADLAKPRVVSVNVTGLRLTRHLDNLAYRRVRPTLSTAIICRHCLRHGLLQRQFRLPSSFLDLLDTCWHCDFSSRATEGDSP